MPAALICLMDDRIMCLDGNGKIGKESHRHFRFTESALADVRSRNSVNVIIHRGAAEIGGSCLEVASGKTRLVFDCGWPLEDEGTAVPPAVPGLFAPGAAPQAVFLTHAHPDHTGFIEQMPTDVPIYSTVATSKMMFVGSLYARGVELQRNRWKPVPFGKSGDALIKVRIDDIDVTAYPVDHSAYGGVAYLVENGGKRLLYTGDLRFHGRKPGMRERLVRELRGTLDVLVIEGTNLGRTVGDFPSEVSVEEHAAKVARAVDSLVMVAFSPQNVDRFVSFFRAAVRTGRTFICDHYMAAVLHMIAERSLPKPAANGKLRVYFPRRRKRVEKLERKARAAAITLDEIRATPEKFMMLARPSLIEDFEGNLPERTRLLFGMWSGYREKLEWRNTERLIAAAAGDFQDCHASGHAHHEDLFSFVNSLSPKIMIPVHTNFPETFAGLFQNCVCLADGKPLQV